ncbi:C-type lectin protein [Lactifluus subvellereus]|nr:C-type lectin protein [Lactifluus subvellereus]
MIPGSMLFEKPIDLKHICLFYTGHIPTFLGIHLSNLLGEPNTEPEYFKNIFERGIDPNVDDPSQCHPHPGVPEKEDDWPSHATILDFKKRVNARLTKLYAELESGIRQLTRRVARVLFITLEHEAWHTETLLYMLIQRTGTGTVPSSVGGFATPCWESLAETWDATPPPINTTVTLGPTTVEPGHDDYEAHDASLDVRDHEFGWDNEHPRRKVDVGEFRIEWRPVTNGEFYEFWKAAKGNVPMPKSWVMNDSNVMVRTLYGLVPMKIAHLWPVVTDYNSLSAYATDRGGRLPTEAELRLFFDKFEISYEEGRNVGFRNWHPIPATTGGEGGGRGHNGGIWEWTSTVWDKYEGFEPSLQCLGFSADIFDTHHNTVIGGSYTTTPRLAERRTVSNLFQRNYTYVWIGGRVVYDATE